MSVVDRFLDFLNQRLDKLNQNHRFALVLIAVVAILLRLPLFGVPLQGDDYNSLLEATGPGIKVNGWLFYEILAFWMRLNLAEAWLRILPVAASIALIPLAYQLARMTGPRNRALLLPAFVAVAPFPFEISLWVRHYSFYLTTSMLALVSVVYVVKHPGRKMIGYLFVLFSMVLLVASHLLGIVLTAVLLGYLFGFEAPTPQVRKKRLVFLAVLGVIGLSAAALPSIRTAGWAWIEQAIASLVRVEYAAPRGWNVAQVVKIVLGFYVFFLGYAVYPLTWWFVLPAFIVAAFGLFSGVRQLWKIDKPLLFLALAALLPFLFVFLLFEPLVPALTETAGPRHVLMAWPAFALILAAWGGASRTGKYSWLLLLIAVGGTAFRYADVWKYGQDGPDWHAVTREVSADNPARTLILFDGRTRNAANYYFPEAAGQSTHYDFIHDLSGSVPETFNRVLVLSNDFKPENRSLANLVIESLAEDFAWREGLVDYPFFMYEFVRSPSMPGLPDFPRQLAHPLQAYSLEFADLALPITVSAFDESLYVPGSFEISSTNQQVRVVTGEPVKTRTVLLLTNYIGRSEVLPGAAVAQLTVDGPAGVIAVIPLRIGEETQSWDDVCRSEAACESVYRWRKRAALVGQRAYPDAWREFDAGLHAVLLDLPENTIVTELIFSAVGSGGALYVWGISLGEP